MAEALRAGDPRRAGPYELLGRLGGGGMGQVYLGRSPGGRPVAVKVIRPELLSGQADFRARFAREVAAARRVGALFTAPVVDADPEAEIPWLVTAYVPGPSLEDAVHNHGPMRAEVVHSLAAGLAEGLAAIHSVGVVHRDLKPSNVLLAGDGPRIIDFGISRAVEASALTGTGFVVGTPAFMSPEQADGRDAGPPSDVFSLGSVLTFAATGDGPFRAGAMMAMLYQVVNAEPAVTGLPAEIRPLVERCLAKDPRDRPTPGEIIAELGPIGLLQDWLPAAVAETLPSYRVPGPSGDPLPAAPSPAAPPAAAVAPSGVVPPTQTAARLPSHQPREPAPSRERPPGPVQPAYQPPSPPPAFLGPYGPSQRTGGGGPAYQPPPAYVPPRAYPPPPAGYGPGGSLASGPLPREYRFGWLSFPIMLFLAVAAFVAPLEVLWGLLIGFAVTVLASRLAAALWPRRRGGGGLAGGVIANLARDAGGAIGLAAIAFGGLFVSVYWLLPAVGPGPAKDYPKALSTSGPADPFASLAQAWTFLHLLLPLPVVAMAAMVLLRTRADLRRPLVLPRAARLLNGKTRGIRLIVAGVTVVLALALVGLNGGLSLSAKPRGTICHIAPLTCSAVKKLEAARHHPPARGHR